MLYKLYQKLYFYVLGMIIVSILSTMAILSLFPNPNGERGMLRGHIKEELVFAKNVIFDSYKSDPNNIKKKLLEIKKDLNWELSIWKDEKCIAFTDKIPNIEEFKKNIKDTNDDEIDIIDKKGTFFVYLDEENKSKGFITVRFRPPPKREPHIHYERILPPLLSIIFLAILMIPFTIYIVRPFKKLMISINNVSLGNFSTKLDVSKNSEFSFIADSFNNMTEKIQDMIQQKQRLIADVSHEIRTPLTKIRLSLELLDKEGKGKQKYIDKGISEIENLDELIDDLLSASKLEINFDSSKFIDIDLVDFIEKFIVKNQIFIEATNFKINYDSKIKEYFIKGDKKDLESVFSNILSNAAKYSHDSSEINITSVEKDGKILIQIRDFGIGVNSNQLEKIFDPFYRTDDSRNRKTGGNGLGLSIVRKIIDNHNGKIWAELPNDGKSGLIINISV
ncbi:MAG: ATP-binding protein [Cyanobacteriota bacterium]